MPLSGSRTGNFEPGGGLYRFDAWKGAEGVDFGIDLSQKVGGQAVSFESDDEKVVVAPKRLPEFAIKRGFRMVCGKNCSKS